jgi:hypothetical protein
LGLYDSPHVCVLGKKRGAGQIATADVFFERPPDDGKNALI